MKKAGILLAVSSLPSEYGIGSFSKEAYKFADWLTEAGQTYWQILPLCPAGAGDSPYQSFSTFAGNPNFIDPETLISKGWLTEKDCAKFDFGTDRRYVDYEKVNKSRIELLRTAFKNSNIFNLQEYKKFEEENSYWLEDYSKFMALKTGNKEKLTDEINFNKFIQYEFYSQWSKLKNYANKKGIKIIGDIPIYVSYDSADVWAHPELFQIDSDNTPTAVAGCPPDGFSAKGQLWGNPLYDWQYHKKTGYEWWIKRLSQCFKLYDVVRIDHFRGFDEYYSIPYGSEDALNGVWKKGCGAQLFKAVENSIGKREYIAEDLGFMTNSVKELVKECGFPNMKVLEFAFDSRDTGNREDYLPHNYPFNCIAYTGTHDNQTIKSWFNTITEDERKSAREYLCDFYTPSEDIYKSFIALIMRSQAETVIIPMQDYLGLDDSCRMNTPSTVGNNWKWRLLPEEMSEELKSYIKDTTRMFSRDNIL